METALATVHNRTPEQEQLLQRTGMVSALLPGGAYNTENAIDVFKTAVQNELVNTVVAGAALYLISELDTRENLLRAIMEANVSERRARDYIMIGKVYGPFLDEFQRHPEWLREIPLVKLEIAARSLPATSFQILDDGTFVCGPFNMSDLRDLGTAELRDMLRPFLADFSFEKRKIEQEKEKLQIEYNKLIDKLSRYRRGVLDYDFRTYRAAYLQVKDALSGFRTEVDTFIKAKPSDRGDDDPETARNMVIEIVNELNHIQELLLGTDGELQTDTQKIKG